MKSIVKYSMVLMLLALVSFGETISATPRHRHHTRKEVVVINKPTKKVRINNYFSQENRLSMAIAYLNNHTYLSIKEYAKITGLTKKMAEAELDVFAQDRRNPITLVVKSNKKIYAKR